MRERGGGFPVQLLTKDGAILHCSPSIRGTPLAKEEWCLVSPALPQWEQQTQDGDPCQGRIIPFFITMKVPSNFLVL